jgi:pilus assembly protein Flp/PilA
VISRSSLSSPDGFPPIFLWGKSGDGRAVGTDDMRRGAIRMDLFVVRTWLVARFTKSDRGASMVEYILLVALIALAVIAAVVFLRGQMSSKFNDAGSTVSRLPNP